MTDEMTKIKFACLGLVALLLGTSVLASTEIVRVDASSTAVAPDGTTWASAYSLLQGGLDRAAEIIDDAPGTPPTVEVWVAKGVYLPSWEYEDQNPRSRMFMLVPGVRMYGGFEGNETLLQQRETPARLNRTILSCDLNGDDFDGDEPYIGDASQLHEDPPRTQAIQTTGSVMTTASTC